MVSGTTSGKARRDYAPTAAPAPDAPGTTDSGSIGWRARRFRPRLVPTLAMALLVPLFIAAGQWQWNKAASKAARQAELEARGRQPALTVPTERVDAETLRYRRVTARGYFEPQYQILIDNRTYRGQAGYHVVTPLHLAGSTLRVLVDRGWVPATADRATLPTIATPPGPVDVAGMAVPPATRFFTLAHEATADQTGAWQNVWQNLDLARYSRAVPFPLQSIVVQLDADSTAGGYVRDWPRPDDRRQTNLGYALQWWTFAATTFGLWLVLNFRLPR